MIKNVKADSLASVFTDNTLSAFTPSAISKGVTQDSIIYITCNASDAATFGTQYIEGSNWIWAKGEIFGSGEDLNKEDKVNKVTSISNSSTDIQYPSAKCIYDEFENVVISESTSGSISDSNLNFTISWSDVTDKPDVATKSDVNSLLPLILAAL